MNELMDVAEGDRALGAQAYTPPSSFSLNQGGGVWIERSAKLFEAGDYPDKGVTITVEDLSRLAESYGEPVPVLIEHAESPLELGYLTGVQALGSELFGTVALSPEANLLVEKSGARSLSLGLAADLSEIREVSLVRNPRVESARLWHGQPLIDGQRRAGSADLRSAALGDSELLVFESADLEPTPVRDAHRPSPSGRMAPEGDELEGQALAAAAGEVFGVRPSPHDAAEGEEPISTPQPPTSKTNHFEEGGSWRLRYERLVTEQEEKEAERQVREFVAAGKLCSAQAPMAKALLLSEDKVAFDGESRPLRQVARELIERQPRMSLFSEIAPDGRDTSANLLLPEEAEFYRKHFPDVSLEEISRAKR